MSDAVAKKKKLSSWIERPDRNEDFAANPVELFFDLAFVFAFAQLVSHLVHHPDVAGMLEAALLFWMLWLPWSQFTWSANSVSAHSRPVQAVMLVATISSIPMAASIQTALGDGGFLFAGSVAMIMLMGLVMIVTAAPNGSDEQKAAVRYGIPNLVAIGLFILGAAIDTQSTRVVIWLVAIAIIGYGTFKAGDGDWTIRAGHFAERHGLILIIALGEIIVAIAVPVLNALNDDDAGLPADTIGALMFAGLFAALLWWAYFDRPQKVFEHRMAAVEGSEKGRMARDVYTYLHSLIVSGVIVSAAALEEITLHPSDELHFEFRVMLLIGLAMFFGGIEFAAMRAFHVVPPERAIAVVVLAVLLLVDFGIKGIVLLAIIDVVILATLILEGRRLEHPGDTDRRAAGAAS